MARVEYGIYPAIGFARVGDLPLDLGDRSSYNLGPERPGWRHWPPQGYDLKRRVDGVGRIKKQGARFRVYRRRWVDGRCQEDILDLAHPDVRRVTWRVLVRNAKAVGPRIFAAAGATGLRNADRQTDAAGRAALILDPGVAYVEGRRTRSELGGKVMPAGFRTQVNADGICTLGTLATDEKGNLIVVGAEGRAVCDAPGSPDPSATFNNDDWFDDTADGSIRAEVELSSGEVVHYSRIAPSWVVTAPPDYAPHVPNLVSLWDVLRDLGVRAIGCAPHIYDRARGRFRDDWRPRFIDDIEPILMATSRLRATHAGARTHVSKFADYEAQRHPQGSKTPAELFAKLRRPKGFEWLPGGSGNMPDLEEATLTPTQYFAMYQWSRGRCDPGSALDDLPRSQQATRAALEQAVGAAFHPGIEVTHSFADATWFLTAPQFEYRIDPAKLAPGEVTKRMALPWHTDFLACGGDWWPTIRPSEVNRAGQIRSWDEGIADNREMVDKWARLGWIDATMAEVERDGV
jgi:hypothetical protein